MYVYYISIARLLEFLSLWFDQTILANCVTAMLIFLGPIFWQNILKKVFNLTIT